MKTDIKIRVGRLDKLLLVVAAIMMFLLVLQYNGIVSMPSHATLASSTTSPVRTIVDSTSTSTSLPVVGSNEYIDSGQGSNSNFYYNEKFLAGNSSFSSNSVSCVAYNEIVAPHLCWNINLFSLFSCGGGFTSANFNRLVGYLGFPQQDNQFGGSNNYANLQSTNGTENSSGAFYVDIPPKYPYQNFINWSSSTVNPYLFGSKNYMYAINYSFQGYDFGQGYPIPESTFIIPAISCGSTFINNYINNAALGAANNYNVTTLSGFTPSVFLASPNTNGFGAYYSFGYLISSTPLTWTGTFNSLLANQVQNISPAFQYAMPSTDYAEFPSGNRGDSQYINPSAFFETTVPGNYFDPTSGLNQIHIYVSNLSVSAINTYTQTTTSQCTSFEIGKGLCSPQPALTSVTQADTFTVPDLQSVYYPNLNNGVYAKFRTDGIFPICAWNNKTGQLDSTCTFYNKSSVNNVSYQRLWYSNYLKNSQLFSQPFTPGYNSTSKLNAFTTTALDSFCFYGENFNLNNGVYTSPDYTRIVPPTASENYTTPIGSCNAFFNNTNCFKTSNDNLLNFNYGIFSSGISCTTTGIHAENVTDAWINSLYIANSGGSFCGDFLGQKNASNPSANSTMFLQQIAGSCPTFNSGDPYVPLVVTVKNVGNTVITNPYLIVLFNDNNISNMFYSTNSNSRLSDYQLYSTFLRQMSSYSGVIQVNYNTQTGKSNMYVFHPGSPLNPIPVPSLFAASGSQYVNGPFNNSLLGLWMYTAGMSGVTVPNNTIRTSNVFLIHSSSGANGVPEIQANGTATFSIQVPMSVYEELVSSRSNISIYFGNSFNVSWGFGSTTPSSALTSSVSVNPLVASSVVNSSSWHNNEYLSASGSPVPLWQYIVSYSANLSSAPFNGTQVYNDSVGLSISAANGTDGKLNVSVTPTVSVFGSSGKYTSLPLSKLKSSSISCFASPDTYQDFSVFWSTQAVSPSNLNYAIGNFYKTNSNVDNVVINRWRGLLFMPYSDQVALNYDNLPVYYSSNSFFTLEKPTQSNSSSPLLKQIELFFGSGQPSGLYTNLADVSSGLNTPYTLSNSTSAVVSGSFNVVATSLRGEASLLRIFVQKVVTNNSIYSGKTITLQIGSGSVCKFTGQTNGSGVYASTSAMSSCLSKLQVNTSVINVSSSSGPFIVQMYNTSSLNMTNLSYAGTVLASSNLTLSKPSNGIFYTSLNVSQSLSNGFTLMFSQIPSGAVLNDVNVNMYYLNDTPFSCAIVDSYGGQQFSNKKISAGKYFLPSGNVICNFSSISSPNPSNSIVRIVVSNSTNNQYIGSADIGLGLAIQNESNGIYSITSYGSPVVSQDLNITNYSNPSCDVSGLVLVNGTFTYKKCSLVGDEIAFYQQSNGANLLASVYVNRSVGSGQFVSLSPSVIIDNPSAVFDLGYNLPSGQLQPLRFSLNSVPGGCDNLRIFANTSIGSTPTPYSEVSYQAVPSSSGACSYVFIGNTATKYLVFADPSPPFINGSNWLKFNYNSQYSLSLSSNEFSGNLVSNCNSGVGPCIAKFSPNGIDMGSVLVNNASATVGSIYQTVSGPVMDCFEINYGASNKVVFPASGFGNIHYSTNKIYQEQTPSQTIQSTYCFYNGAPVITDVVSASGQPVNFNIGNSLTSAFTGETDNGGGSNYVSFPKSVGYSGFYNVSLYKSKLNTFNISDYNNILTKCNNVSLTITPNVNPSGTVNVTSADITPNSGTFYCVYNGIPTYSSGFSISSSSNSYTSTSEAVGYLFSPGNYTKNGNTVYDSCRFANVSSGTTVYVNGLAAAYNPSDPTQALIVNHPSSFNNNEELLFNPKNTTFINKCPINSTILSYSACTGIGPNVVPGNGSYDSIEAIPTSSQYSPTIGGGCFIGSLNGIQYSCAPTDGALSYVDTNSVSSTTGSASLYKLLYNSSSAPTQTPAVTFYCSVSLSLSSTSNSSTKALESTCSYPSNPSATGCSAKLTTSKIASGEYNISGICSSTSVSGFTTSSSTVKAINISVSSKQSESTGLTNANNFVCGNLTSVISSKQVPSGWVWTPFVTRHTINPLGINEVGGCEAGRTTFVVKQPTITTNPLSGLSFQQTYSCSSDYSGSILSCSTKSALPSSVDISTNTCSVNSTIISQYLKQLTVSGKNNGGAAISCNPFPQKNYTTPTVSDGCIAYHDPINATSNASYELQYSNTSMNYGIGLALFNANQHYPLNVSIPNSLETNQIKDQYMTSLTVSQQESINLMMQEYPTNLLLSSLPGNALTLSSVYSFDMLNMIMLQNPAFGVSGIPAFANGSVFDYAMNLFTSGTSSNCELSNYQNDYGIFKLGEGQLCSGSSLPSIYSNGIYLPLGALNSGAHSIQFYSVSETGNTSSPTVSVYDTGGKAVNLNSACSNGNQRVFTSTYNGGSWNFNISSDENCNPINNKLYGYIISCIYQTPGNTTYTTTSQYYLAYNLPTVWNISYTLLVSPRAYNIIPVPVYKLTTAVTKNSEHPTGAVSTLTLEPPVKTVFTETGLKSGLTWSVVYAGLPDSVNTSSMSFYTTNGTYGYSVNSPSYSTSSPDCTYTYTPNPIKGSAKAGTTVAISFTESSSCTSVFSETGLPSNTKWYTIYNDVNKSSTSASIDFSLSAGNYSFSVGSVKTIAGTCTSVYAPTPSSGYLVAGINQNIKFVFYSDKCVTTFSETGLPSGTKWYLDFNNTNSSSTSTTMSFVTNNANKIAYIVYNVYIKSSSTDCLTTYTPSPSSGSVNAGASTSINFASSTSCITTFTESSLPSGDLWSVTYDGQKKTSTSNQIQFTTGPGSFSWTSSASSSSSGNCKTTYNTPSGSSTAGNSVSISFTGSSSCTNTFFESNLPGGYTWKVSYAGTSGSASTGSGIILVTTPLSYTPTASASVSSLACTASASVAQGTSYTFSSWSCTTTFTETGLPTGQSWSVKYNGNTGSSTTSTITFGTGASSSKQSFSVNSITVTSSCPIGETGSGYTTVYTPSPTTGSLFPGQSESISFTPSTSGFCRIAPT